MSSAVGRNSGVSSSLSLYVVDDKTVNVIAKVELSGITHNPALCFVLPFSLESDPPLSVMPVDAPYAIGTVQQSATVVLVWTRIDSREVEIHGTTHYLIDPYDSWLKIELDFDYSSLPQVMAFRERASNSSFMLVDAFDEVNVSFSPLWPNLRVEDNPKGLEKNGYRQYLFEDIMKSGDKVIVRFPARSGYVGELFNAAGYLVPSVVVIIVREDLRRRPRVVKAAAIVCWTICIAAAYSYYTNLLSGFAYSLTFLVYGVIFSLMALSGRHLGLRNLLKRQQTNPGANPVQVG